MHLLQPAVELSMWGFDDSYSVLILRAFLFGHYVVAHSYRQVWGVVICAIFFHVWQTIQRGAESLAQESGEWDLPASTLLLRAFQQEKAGFPARNTM